MNITIRKIVRGAYDLQKLRISTGNRVVGNFKVKLGLAPSHGEDELDKEGKKILKQLRASYRRITDGIATMPRQSTFKGDGLIETYTELVLVSEYYDLLRNEEQHFRRLAHVLDGIPIYDEYLRDLRGVGPAIAGVLISEIDITKAEYPSSLWKYAGLDVAEDGRGRSRKQEHLVKREYIDKDGKPAVRNSITYNPFLKTKLTAVLGPSLIRTGSEYRKIYDDYKYRLEHHERYRDQWVIVDKDGVQVDGPLYTETAATEEAQLKGKGYKAVFTGASKLHRHNMAVRYMAKIFLVDLYKAWRKIEGLPVAPPYSEAKLGKMHKVA